MHRIHWLSAEHPADAFPDTDLALRDPDGLLAAGGDLSTERLLSAYQRGIFPWYEEGQPVLWWSPDPRAVLRPDTLHISRSLRRSLRRRGYEITWNRSFSEVIAGCAEPRPGQSGTWITAEMASAYGRLFEQGWAHSVEIRLEGRLVGGLYGLAMGQVFFGESMFSRETDASKTAMVALAAELTERDFVMIDCQVVSDHLLKMGARMMPRREFLAVLGRHCARRRSLGALPEVAVEAASLAAFGRVAKQEHFLHNAGHSAK